MKQPVVYIKPSQLKSARSGALKLHPLSNGHWSVWVNGNWRMTFMFEGMDAVLVDYLDYH